MTKSSKIAIIILAVLLIFVCNYDYDKERQPRDFPHPHTFSLDVSCDGNASVGNVTPIDCTLRNTGSEDYTLSCKDIVLFQVYVDGKQIDSTGAAEGSTATFLMGHGKQRDEQHYFTPEKPGIHQIRVTAVFIINPIGTPKNPPDLRKPQEYSYQKTLVVDSK